MASTSPAARILPIIITVLALADGALHLSLDFVLFRGNLFGSGFSGGPPPGRPPGAPPGGARPPAGPGFQPPLPLNELFLLNLIGYVILVLLFWFGPRWLGKWRWVTDVALLVYVVVVFSAWWSFGRPNPMGLGYLSKAVEILLVIALISHAWLLLARRNATVGRASS